MITRLVAALLVSAGLVALPGGPATSTGPTVTAANMTFFPSTITVPVGSTVTWRFPDAVPHTTTSTQDFWDSGSQSDGDTYQHTFASAGSYPYVCTFHAMMTGTVKVPVARTGSSSGWTLTWSSEAGSATYDVQVRKGTGAWKVLKAGTSDVSTTFARKGTWSVRARTHDGGTSSWSPTVKLTSS